MTPRNEKEPQTSPLPIRSYHPKKTEQMFTAWNERLNLIRKQREQLAADAEALRQSMFADNGEPASIPVEVLKLHGRRLALDVAELRLLSDKNAMKKPHLDARAKERDRLAALEKRRYDEIMQTLKTANIETNLVNGIVSGDQRLRALKAERGSVSSFENVVTADDDMRAEYLADRIAAAVPTI